MGCSESAPDANGHITLDAKQAGKRSAGNPHAAFDEAGAGNVIMGAGLRTNAKVVGFSTGPYRRRASPRPYHRGEGSRPVSWCYSTALADSTFSTVPTITADELCNPPS